MPSPKSKIGSNETFLCRLALRASQFWDWIDQRQIDAMLVSLAVLYGTTRILEWSFQFASHADRPGMEVAAIIAAVATPYSALQAAAIKFFFDARKGNFTGGQ